MDGVRARIIYPSGVSGTACLCNAKNKIKMEMIMISIVINTY
jgi:hypothetical protein